MLFDDVNRIEHADQYQTPIRGAICRLVMPSRSLACSAALCAISWSVRRWA